MSDSAELFSKAVSALNNRDLGMAETLFKQVLKSNARHAPALNLLAVVLMSGGRFADAEPLIAKAVQLDPSSDVSWYNYGLVSKQLKKNVQALKAFTSALKLNPNVPETWNNRGTVFIDLKNYDAAIEDFEAATVLNPRYGDALANKSRALEALARHDEALSAYDTALSVRPDLTEAWIGRGNILADLGRCPEALTRGRDCGRYESSARQPG